MISGWLGMRLAAALAVGGFCGVVRADDDAYIAARAIQLFAPGVPQVYYVGLLAGSNDTELMEESGELRDINRHYYSLEEAAEATRQPVVQRLLALMRLRSHHPAFEGDFELHYSNDSSVSMGWRKGKHYCLVLIDLRFKTSTVSCSDVDGGEERVFRL